MHTPTPFGYRIVGCVQGKRRLVDASAAFLGYAACDDEAEIQKEAYLSAFQFGGNIRQRDNGWRVDTRGYDGLCWSPWLWFDIDRDDIVAATQNTRRLAAFLAEKYALDGDELLIFFSGAKGYHLGLPTSLWHPEPSTTFHKSARQFAEALAGQVGITIDTAIYDKVRAFRAPNSRHPKTGRHKRRVAYDELLKVSPQGILDRATEPLPFELPDASGPHALAIQDWEQAMHAAQQATVAVSARRRNGHTSVSRLTLEFIREGAPVGERHSRLFSAAANLGEFGSPPELAHALLTEAALDSGLAPADVRRHIDRGLQHGSAEATSTNNEKESAP